MAIKMLSLNDARLDVQAQVCGSAITATVAVVVWFG